MEELKLKEQEYEEWKIRVDDIEYENEKLKYKKFKIERHLSEAAETLEKLKMQERSREKCDSFSPNGKKVNFTLFLSKHFIIFFQKMCYNFL